MSVGPRGPTAPGLFYLGGPPGCTLSPDPTGRYAGVTPIEVGMMPAIPGHRGNPMSTRDPEGPRPSEAWRRWPEEMAKGRVLSRANLDLQAVACEAHADFEDARERLRESIAASRDARTQSAHCPERPW